MPKQNPCFAAIFWLTAHIFAVPGFMCLVSFFKLYDFLMFSPLFGGRTTKEVHARKVRDVQSQVKAWNEAGRKNRMCTGRSAWKTLSVHNISKSKYTQINVDLNDIVEIDTENQLLTVEPGMMMGKLTGLLLPQGWTIGVIPEFETLTVGGCVCGTGIETTSGKFGLFNETCQSYEVVLANGKVVNCSKEENPDLFYAIPWSHATIGFLTAVRIPLIRATKYVKLEYVPTNSLPEATKLLGTQGHHFVEGIAYSLNRTVVMFGDLTDEVEPGKVNRINRWFKPWFYKHAETFLYKRPKQGPFIEYIPLREYYHRHTRSYFWEAEYMIPYGNNPLFRWIFGWFYPLNFQLCKIVAAGLGIIKYAEQFFPNHVLQDYMVPIEKFEVSMKYFDDLVQVYPAWLCPCKFPKHPGMVQPKGDSDELYVDIGLYGDVSKNKRPQYKIPITTDQMEQFLLQQHGFQFLYADCFLSREDFHAMFDMQLYENVRAQFQCEDAFPHVYDKISKIAKRIPYV